MGYIYKLLKSRVVVYVGQALDIERRIKQHKKDDRITFDDVEFFTVELSDMDSIEADEIFKCQPTHNRMLQAHGKYTSERLLLDKIKEVLREGDKASKVGSSFYYTITDAERIAQKIRDALL